jgi:hypothetical protein
MNRTAEWVALATLYSQKLGLSVIPMNDEKKPLVKWLELQERRPTVREIVAWVDLWDGEPENLAIVTGAISNLCVVDCDSREAAIWFHKAHGGSPVMVKTRRGVHFYFRHPGQRIANGIRLEGDGGVTYDVKGDGGYVVAPPSRHSQGCYSWIKPLLDTSKLPPFNPAWRPERATQERSEREIRDGLKYISQIRAVAGQGGHAQTFKAACYLKESGLSESEALLALQCWNKTNCDPIWTDRELLHKIRSAYS